MIWEWLTEALHLIAVQADGCGVAATSASGTTSARERIDG